MKQSGMQINIFTLLFLLTAACNISHAQQVPDTTYSANIPQPKYKQGKGPVVCIDQAHYNFHTRQGGFIAFSKLLQQDGYKVNALSSLVASPEVLAQCKILVIANALDSSNLNRWILPTPSAFSDKEIATIKNWVENGGSLLLIADHMPFAGAAYKLGNAFGFGFLNGFAITRENSWPPSVFTLADKSLNESPITTGAKGPDRINTVTTFTGSAFKSPQGAIPVLSFIEGNYALMPDTAWAFNAKTPRKSLPGYRQGALLEYGKGKVAVFGEAAMFTAQIVNGQMKVGFNSDDAPQNVKFILNLMHWLD